MKAWEDLLAGCRNEDPFYERVLGERREKPIRAALRSEGEGCLAGISWARRCVEELGVSADWQKDTGDRIQRGEVIGRFEGKAECILRLENLLIGFVSKPSGIATAGMKAVAAAGGRCRLVSGGWKKHPFPVRDLVREAVCAAGLAPRMLDPPFIYLDKNYVRLFGGVRRTLESLAAHLAPKVIQVRGEFSPVADEAREAIRCGAAVVMVDTGSWEDLEEVLRVVKEEKAVPKVRTAFAGGIRMEDISPLVEKGVDILDIGAAILDAPWLELSYDLPAHTD